MHEDELDREMFGDYDYRRDLKTINNRSLAVEKKVKDLAHIIDREDDGEDEIGQIEDYIEYLLRSNMMLKFEVANIKGDIQKIAQAYHSSDKVEHVGKIIKQVLWKWEAE